jgi:diadenylate cyclase
VAHYQNQSPLHDGAVVIPSGRIAKAGCILPLTMSADVPEGLGTRHRAAIGITEETDAVVVVVSEETSGISLVANEEMLRNLDAPRLRAALARALARDRREPRAPADAEPAAASERAAAPAEDSTRARSVG